MFKLFSRKQIANVMFLSIGLAFAVQIFTVGTLISSDHFSGVVYAAGVPVFGAMISASGSNGYGYAITDTSGHYTINKGLQAGTYNVTVIALGYLQAESDNVQVTVGQTTTPVNFNLQLSGGISGKVTDTSSSQTLKDIIVIAIPSGGGAFGWVASTDINGNYILATNLATGTYNVSVLLPENHIPKTIGPISVTAGVEVKNQNIALDPSGIISGRATTASSAPLANVSIIAFATGFYGSTETNATGYYRITTGLGTGTYEVMATYDSNIPVILTDIAVSAGSEHSGVDFTLTVSPPTPSGIIMGKVTDTSSNPITDAHVTASGETTSGYGYTDTDGQGNYVISSGLVTDTYTVSASAKGYSPANVTHVTVTVGQVMANVNLQLSPIPPAQSGAISGTVQGDANPVPELQYPIALLMLTTLAAAALARSLNAKKAQ